MIPKTLKFDREAREALLKGMNTVADAVSTTLGPKGQNVAINKNGNPPQIIHDGVTVAKSIDLEDPFEDMGAQLIKDASLQTSKKAGDGTTTSTILAQAIVNKGVENVIAGSNPMTLKNEIDDAYKLALKEIKKLSKPVKTLEEKQFVAKISSASEEIGNLVAEVVDKVGHDGLVSIEEASGIDTYVEYKQGLEFNRGYLSPNFINVPEEGKVVIRNPRILFTDIRISKGYQIIPFLENINKMNIKDFVIIGDVSEEALQILVLNKIKAGLNVVAVLPPSFGEMQLGELEDMATLTNGSVILNDSGRELNSVILEELGTCKEFSCNLETSKIIGGAGSKKAISDKIDLLEKSLKYSTSQFEKDSKKRRLSKLGQKVAIIHVGAVADSELTDKIERVDDAVNATKAAVEEGIVAGGEITLLYLSKLSFWKDNTGHRILREAVKEPFKKLMENSGYDYAEVWGKLNPLEYPYGIDAIDGEKKNMIENGILDPCKVTRLALENAVSVATMGITTKVLISEKYEE